MGIVDQAGGEGKQEFQSRWVAFATAQGKDPGNPTLRNFEFINWVSARWAEWRSEVGKTAATPITESDHEAFDAWLAECAA